MASLLPLIFMFLWTQRAQMSEPPDLRFMEYLDQDRLVCLSWGFDNHQGNITFELVVNTTGWVGFGFSPNGGMKGSDIVIGGIGPTGNYFADYHATGKSMPVVDKLQSYTLLSLEESDGQTRMSFRRPIQSCDDQDFHIRAQPVKLIYAFGLTDDIGYHRTHRGTREVNLLNYSPRAAASNSSDHFSVTVEQITVPAIHTYYHCKIMPLPTFNTKHHIYLVEPDIEHHDLVHHMLLYRCPSYVTEVSDGQCYRGGMGDACFAVVAAWGIGGRAYQLPENTGIPIGGEDHDVLYRLEIHYNNPNKEADRTDSSGLRLHHRPAQPGQHDVGTLTTGVQPGYVDYNIPPKAAHFHTYGVCNTTVFPQHVKPIPDLQVFAVLPHTHLVGREVRAAHYRNGEQIDFIFVEENYNFEMQQAHHLGNVRTIKQGDEIAVECTYSTTNRSRVTKMGLATTEEMCLAFLLYYPLIEVTSCVSRPNTTHPLMSTSDWIFNGNSSDQDEIASYEEQMKTLPQIQAASDDNFGFSVYENGFIREMMKTPTVTCADNVPPANGSNVLRTSCILSPSGIILLLFWITSI
ncbi:DBH-like monooxygenase protein 2 homolog isoform X1 [Takifugu rubripes]|uniref:DBH-like monooxygenase protein 2 homolog isoform X1 n=2 Tax=Takifugu rubripes TaxID=31033 RepID=UPI0011460C92|nr:DBH-like monooxygenase protein 2 homolog isoform X1 [Takifugu rubripes]